MAKRIQNKIAESRWALPICSAYTILICLISGLVGEGIWLQLAMTALATLLMVELNNSNALIRIYSRMVSCTFLVLTMISPHHLESTDGCLVTLCCVAFFLALCHAYQNKEATGWVMIAFTAIGIASIVWIQILLLIPILWIILATNILAFSLKTFVSSILGIAMPYWFMAAYYLNQGDISPIGSHFAEIAKFGKPLLFTDLSAAYILPLSFVSILTIIGIIHFLRSSYKDKIRTRMIFEMFIVASISAMAFILLQPQHSNMAMRMLIVSASPLIGHFLALTSTKLTNIATLAFMAAALLITAYNIWM